jgi:hypothetical protein
MTGDSQRHPRWRVGERVEGWVSPDHKVSLLDLSLEGTLIEHSNLLRPGTLAFLNLSLPEQDVSLPCRVVRSMIHRFEAYPSGERSRTYRTGLKFLGLSEECQWLLGQYIDLVTERATQQVVA